MVCSVSGGRFCVCYLLIGLLLALCGAVAGAGEAPEGMVVIPAGAFTMGAGSSPPLGPQRSVTLSAYYIDRTEVTVVAYKKCVAAGRCQWNPNATSERFFGDDQPMVLVNWHDAKAYCEFAGKRLPTEAEWEKAARGEAGNRYPWGNEYEANRANLADTTDAPVDLALYRFTWPVGKAPGDVSAYGVRDMAGNVNEWTADTYRADYHEKTSGTNPRASAKGEDPQGRRTYTVRGGSFANNGGEAALFQRDGWRHAAGRGLRLGFRCSKDVP